MFDVVNRVLGGLCLVRLLNDSLHLLRCVRPHCLGADIACQRDRSRLIIGVPQVEDLSVEQLALRQGRSLFEEIYGITVQLRPEVRREPRPSSSQF